MDFGNLLSNYDDVPGSGLTSNNALGDIMDAVDIPQVGSSIDIQDIGDFLASLIDLMGPFSDSF